MLLYWRIEKKHCRLFYSATYYVQDYITIHAIPEQMCQIKLTALKPSVSHWYALQFNDPIANEYDAPSLEKIIDTQHKVIEYQKKQGMKKLFSCLLIIDDFAEDKTFMRYSKILHGLYTKSRHFGLSVITATQKYNALAPIVRLNSSSLYIFKLKNMAEVDAFVQEQSALVDKNTVYQIYKLATEDKPYSFLFVKLRESDVNKIFMIRFERAIHIDNSQMV